jgi:hypothetical protein
MGVLMHGKIHMKHCLGFLLSSLIVLSASLSRAQKFDTRFVEAQFGTIDAVLSGLNGGSWEKRCDAFYHLLGYESYAKWDGRTDLIPSKLAGVFSAHPEGENELKLALIKLLSTENATVEAQNEEFKRTRKTLTEDYTNYYGDLIAAVAGLKDSRALDSLVGAMGTGGMATGALAEFGQISLDPIIAKLRSADPFVRAAATRTLQVIVQPEYRIEFGDDVSHQKIKSALLRAATDSDGGVRLAAATGLALIPDTDVIAMLKKLASSDQAKLPGQADGGGDFYPVRQAAKRALASIGQ